MSAPESRFYQSHGLRLHYADWGNDSAPLLVLVHGGRDHCRSWDAFARALQPHFHVVAPDLRGHGDSEWTRGGSYALTEYVYDLSRLLGELGGGQATLVGHSMGGMVSLIYTGTFPDRVAALVVLDGITVLPNAPKLAPPHERITKWIGQLDALHDRALPRMPDVGAAAERMIAHNRRLPRELALHLATHGTRRNDDGSLSWKFDPCQHVSGPHRLWVDDHLALWSRISCPTLLLNASESFLGTTDPAGLAALFPNARGHMIDGAGHWLQHDRPDEVLAAIRRFLGVPVAAGG